MYEDVPDSDEELSVGHGSPSDISAASSQAGSLASHASSADITSAEVLSRPSTDCEAQESTAAEQIATVSNKGKGVEEQPPDAHNNGSKPLPSSLSNSTQVESDQSQEVAGAAAAEQPTAGHTSASTSHADVCRQDANTEQPEHATEYAREQQHQKIHAQAPSEPVLADHSNGFAVLPGDPSVAAHGLSAETRKRKAATVFDQGVAEQAEAADVNAGIAADPADDLDADRSMPTHELLTAAGDASNEPPNSASDNHAPGSLPKKQPPKAAPRLAPWR